MAFPGGPYTNGQVVVEKGITYYYNTTLGAFVRQNAALVTSASGGFSVGTLANRPSSANDAAIYLVSGDPASVNNGVYWIYDTGTSAWYNWYGAATATTPIVTEDVATAGLMLPVGAAGPKIVYCQNPVATIAVSDASKTGYYSYDGGLTFLSTQLNATYLNYGTPAADPLSGLIVMGVIDNPGYIITSSNNGATWTAPQKVGSLTNPVTDAIYSAGRFYYIMGDNTIVYGPTSNPYGWQVYGSTSAFSSIKNLSFGPNNEVYISGTGTGAYPYYFSGGWAAGLPSSETMMGFAFGANRMAGAMLDGKIYGAAYVGGTTNGSSVVYNDPTAVWRGLIYTSAKNEFVAVSGTSGKIVRSTNGTTWTPTTLTVGFSGVSYGIAAIYSIVYSPVISKYLIAGTTADGRPFIANFA